MNPERNFKCAYCDHRSESKYARKQHEKHCSANPASVITTDSFSRRFPVAPTGFRDYDVATARDSRFHRFVRE